MNSSLSRLLFLLFFLSGFCSLVYQVVWTRMAFAAFGIITPVLSVVLSVFMLGLALGSWAGGRWIAPLTNKTGLSALYFYAAVEGLIGLGAFAVPKLFALGESALLTSGETNSFRYLSLSALVLAASLLPWCVCMGATFPLMMAFVRERVPQSTESFSFLYLANVLGAMSGAFLTAIVLVELFGFRHTLWIAAAGNFTIATISGWLGGRQRRFAAITSWLAESSFGPVTASRSSGLSERLIQWILFSTGFCAMAMEVVWARAFTWVLGTQVYSFAMIVFTYLGATFLGSLWYRRARRSGRLRTTAQLVSLLAIAAFLPVLAIDPWLFHWWLFQTGKHADLNGWILVLASICPLCVILGYLTPGLIDEYAAGHPAAAGRAYAINVFGCILGPLFASYVLVPWFSERIAIILLGLPFLVFFSLCLKCLSRRWRLGSGLAAAFILAWSLFFAREFEDFVLRYGKNTVIRRDYAASVVSHGEGRDKILLVNGMGMTSLTPVTKFMVHLPLAFHKGPPRSALIVCFGMGTTYRSALSWGVETTAVELVPSVVKAFGFYHADAATVLDNPMGHIVIDDGRRYLKRTRQMFDVIVIDPPPPPEAAGSSLLYSTEFYELAKQHMNPHGILQAWFPGGEFLTAQAVLRSLHESFPYVRCFDSIQGSGTHFLASMEPIEMRTAVELAARMPPRAKEDLVEWSTTGDLRADLAKVLSQEVPLQDALNPYPEIRITDDYPFNEYFLLRRLGLYWL